MDETKPISAIKLPNPAMLPNQYAPWKMSKRVFQHTQSANNINSYSKCEITSNDPEWLFIHSYFASHPPENQHIGKVYCIHNPASSKGFEAQIPLLEIEAEQPAFAPKWNKGPEAKQRQKVMDRWSEMTSSYSSIVIPDRNQSKNTYHNVKILPLWHGTTAATCDSISKTGFTSFGKQDIIHDAASPGPNTDIGYFGRSE